MLKAYHCLFSNDIPTTCVFNIHQMYSKNIQNLCTLSPTQDWFLLCKIVHPGTLHLPMGVRVTFKLDLSRQKLKNVFVFT